MSPWVSFAFSLVALVASGVALWFTWKFQARADLVFWWDDKAVSRFVDDRIPIVDLVVTNTGNATARDIRVNLSSATRADREFYDGWLDLKPAEQEIVGVPLVHVERASNGELHRLDKDERGAWTSTTLKPTVTIKWRRDWGHGYRQKKFKIVGTGY